MLGALSALVDLDISCNANIDDISPLSGCGELTCCDLSWTSVVDLMPLKGCANIWVDGLLLASDGKESSWCGCV